MCDHADALAKEFRTGDLIRVSFYENPQVFLFAFKGDICFTDKVSYETCEQIDLDYLYATAMSHVKRFQKVLRVKKASEIVKWLEDNGYQVDHNGHWWKTGEWGFNQSMWQYCGKKPDEDLLWKGEWLEEHYV